MSGEDVAVADQPTTETGIWAMEDLHLRRTILKVTGGS
jgi:hypothetical protein